MKASNNLIRAVEQGIITEQTKTRLKEPETQIAGLDFEIEKELQKTFISLSPAAIEKHLRSKICENTRDIRARKLLVDIFIRKIILFEDKTIITYNFTDLPDKTKHSEEQFQKIVKQAETATLPAFSFPFGSYKLTAAAPDESPPRPDKKVGARRAFQKALLKIIPRFSFPTRVPRFLLFFAF